MHEALPGVADPAVHLDGGLTHGSGGAGAVRLRDRAGFQPLTRWQRVDRPGRVLRQADRTFHEDARLGEQVLHRLERADGDAVLVPLLRVLAGRVEHTFHGADEVGDRDGQGQRPTAVDRGPVDRFTDRRVLRVGDNGHGRQRAGEIGRRRRVGDGHGDDPAGVVVAFRCEEESARHSRAVDGNALGRTAGGHDGEIEQRWVEHHRGAVVAELRARVPGEVGGDHRAEERRVGRGPPQLLGDDRHLDARGERAVVVAGTAELEPSRGLTGLGEASPSAFVVEIRHRARREVGEQRGRRRPQLDLLARVAGVHADLRRSAYSTAWPATKRDGSCALPWSKSPLRRMNVVDRRRMRQPSGVRAYSSVYQPRRILCVVCSMNT